MKYHQYSFLQDIISECFSSPHDQRIHTNCKKKWVPTCCHNLLSCDSKQLLDGWPSSSSVAMVRLLILNSLCSPEQILIITRSTPLYCPLQSPIHLVLQDHPPWLFQAYLIPISPSSTSRREPRGICHHTPSSRMKSTMTPFIAPSTPPPRHRGLGTSSTPNFTPKTMTHLLNCFLVRNNHPCTLFWLQPNKVKEERNSSRNMKMMLIKS